MGLAGDAAVSTASHQGPGTAPPASRAELSQAPGWWWWGHGARSGDLSLHKRAQPEPRALQGTQPTVDSFSISSSDTPKDASPMSCGGGAVRVLEVSVLPPPPGLLEAAKVREPPGIRWGPGGPLPDVPGRSSRWQHKARPGPRDHGLPGPVLPGHCAEVVSPRHQPSIPGQRTPPEVSRPRWALCSPGRVGEGCPLVASPVGDRVPRPQDTPGKTARRSGRRAWARAPAARGSSPCVGGGEWVGLGPPGRAACPPQPQTPPPVLLRRPGGEGWSLTAPGSAWARRRGGCTGCTGTRGRPGWPGSPARTAGRPRAAAGSRSSLLGRGEERRAVTALTSL